MHKTEKTKKAITLADISSAADSEFAEPVNIPNNIETPILEFSMPDNELSVFDGFNYDLRNIRVPLSDIYSAADMLSDFCNTAGIYGRICDLHIVNYSRFYNRRFLRLAVSETKDGKKFYRIYIDMDRQTPRVLVEPTRDFDILKWCIWENHAPRQMTISGKSVTFYNYAGECEIFPIRESLRKAFLLPFYEHRGNYRERNFYRVDDLLALCKTYKTGTTFPVKQLGVMLSTARAQQPTQIMQGD